MYLHNAETFLNDFTFLHAGVWFVVLEGQRVRR
jgi:hypothetical protein